MKNLVIAFIAILAFSSCKEEHSEEYLTLAGELENATDSIITISSQQNVALKTIKLNADGTFKDTLKIKTPAVYTFQVGQKRAPIYLKNGYNLEFKGDDNDFMKSFSYSGEGSGSNNFILAQIAETEKLANPAAIFALDSIAYLKKVDEIKNAFKSIKDKYNDVDSTLVAQADQQYSQITDYLDNNYSAQHQMAVMQMEAEKKTAKGMTSPTFMDYENAKGGENSLDSFKGKYVYIDVWATWCRPCIEEIPALQSLEKEYAGKNVEFLSISTDEPQRSGGSWDAARTKWLSFVKDRNMSGVQLWAGEDFAFQQEYMINAIPRFIIIDPSGNIVDSNAPRPSDPSLKTLFTELGI